MRRATLNFVVDVISFIDLLCLAFTGLIIKWILPPGTGGYGRLLHEGRGRIEIEEFWAMTRHEWGDIHFYLAALFVLLMAVHIFLHWTWIKSYFTSLLVYYRAKLTFRCSKAEN